MPKMTDEELAAKLMSGIGRSVGMGDSLMSKERTEVTQYYAGEKPARAHGGDSGYMSLDVYDAVESMKAQLLETFTGNSRPAEFVPQNGEDTAAAQVRTDYVTDVLFVQNRGFSILRDTIHDGLTARLGVVKVWWENLIEYETYDMTEPTLAELQAHMGDNPKAKLEHYEIDEAAQTIKRVRLSMPKDRSGVRIKVLPPEEFGISAMSEDIPSAKLVYHKSFMTVSALLKSGYDRTKVEELQDSDRLDAEMEPERLERFNQTDDVVGRDEGLNTTAGRVLTVYECYPHLDMDGSGIEKMWKVVICGDVILDKEPVERRPFVMFAPLPLPHTIWGSNYAKLVIPTQVARTYLTRSIINHARVTNNPRIMVVQGGVMNPREIMENRIGGIVNVKRPDAIVPFPQAGLNPFVFQTINMLDEDKEEITGISKLSQGLNKDAISTQNSGAMVNELISVSQIRQKIVARNFAEGFMRDLYTAIYELVVENEDRAKIAQVAGQWQPIDFTAWPPQAEMAVAFTLGYGEQEKEAAKWSSFDKMMSMEPGLASMYPMPKRYGVIKKIMELSGIKNVTDYILTPDQVPPPSPSPMQQADLAVKQADAKVKLANAEAASRSVALGQQKAQMQAMDHTAKMTLANQTHQQKADLDHAKFAHQVAVDAAEIQMQQTAQAAGKLNAGAAPV